jgi:MSHA biogenesis protein MshP
MTLRPSHHPRQAGVGLVTAIFLLVVLAGLAVAMVSIYTTQQGARAYQAARAGAEWGMFQVLRAGACAPSTPLPMPAGTTLSGFTVVVRCTTTGEGDLARHLVSASACNITDSTGGCNCDGGAPCQRSNDPETVNRRVEAQL